MAAPVVVALVAFVSMPIAAMYGGGQQSLEEAELSGAGFSQGEQGSFMSADTDTFVENQTGSQVTILRLDNGFHTGTATERFARPALSLIKLYIAEYVLEHGELKDRADALEMIRSSNDEIAEEMFEKYPECIDIVAKEYGLASTRSRDTWGYSVTSTYDVVSFVSQKLRKNRNDPILRAMKESDKIAADGYEQNFGTSTLPGVIGTKWGWSNDLTLHSSVSYGENFVVAVAVSGTAEDLTDLVELQVAGLMEE
ncbi:hypothetical protein CCANI_03810 [Corynebacterium canis]|nr:hypothetical protein CCANI_03810 [Corynebacterium canis]